MSGAGLLQSGTSSQPHASGNVSSSEPRIFSHKLPSSCKAHLDNFRQKGIFPESWRGRVGGEVRGWLYLETSFKSEDPVVAAASWGDAKQCGGEDGSCTVMEKHLRQQFMAVRGFCSLQLTFGVCCCPSSLSCPGMKQGPGEILWRFGPVALGQR